MKVLLINASAKNFGATQEILKILRETLPKGTDSSLVCLGDLDIGYCKGCKRCYERCACVLDDGMTPLVAQMKEADILVFAAPSYWADVPGQFKVFIDRCTPFSDTNPNPRRPALPKGKKGYAIALRTGRRPVECEQIVETVRHWCGHMGVDFQDSMMFFEIENKEDILRQKDALLERGRQWFSSL